MEQIYPYLPGFIAAFSIQAMAVASPGPSVALILGLAMSHGRLAAMIASLGIATGSACIALATTQGLGLLMERVAWLSIVIRIAGVGYLLWLALQAWRKATEPPRVKIMEVKRFAGLRRSFVTGFLLQVTNPKAIVFWLAIATVGATENAPIPVLLLFITIAFAISLTGHGAYAILLSSKPFRIAYNRARRWIEAAIGSYLIYVAFWLVIRRG